LFRFINGAAGFGKARRGMAWRGKARQGKFMNTFSTSKTQFGVPASVRLHAGDPDLVASDVIVVAYRRWVFRQLRREHVADFEALTGALADVTILRLRDQITADGGTAVVMLDTVPQDGLIKLTVIENCEIALYRRETDYWQTSLAGWLRARQTAGVRQRSIMVCGWRLEYEVAQIANVPTQFSGDVVIAGRWCAPAEWFVER